MQIFSRQKVLTADLALFTLADGFALWESESNLEEAICFLKEKVNPNHLVFGVKPQRYTPREMGAIGVCPPSKPLFLLDC